MDIYLSMLSYSGKSVEQFERVIRNGDVIYSYELIPVEYKIRIDNKDVVGEAGIMQIALSLLFFWRNLHKSVECGLFTFDSPPNMWAIPQGDSEKWDIEVSAYGKTLSSEESYIRELVAKISSALDVCFLWIHDMTSISDLELGEFFDVMTPDSSHLFDDYKEGILRGAKNLSD